MTTEYSRCVQSASWTLPREFRQFGRMLLIVRVPTHERGLDRIVVVLRRSPAAVHGVAVEESGNGRVLDRGADFVGFARFTRQRPIEGEIALMIRLRDLERDGLQP